MDVVGEAHPLPAELGLAVYRTVQEAITNATKYAGASAPIAVVLTWSPLALSVEVRNGPGDKRAPALPSGGYGLAGLAERARLAGGRFDSGPDGDGWRVQLTLPLAVGAPAAVSA
jgi:signal transduction histidine kinase